MRSLSKWSFFSGRMRIFWVLLYSNSVVDPTETTREKVRETDALVPKARIGPYPVVLAQELRRADRRILGARVDLGADHKGRVEGGDIEGHGAGVGCGSGLEERCRTDQYSMISRM
jgi:hypothetical protein